MKHTKEYWLDAYAHPERYAAELAEEFAISGTLQEIIKEVKELAKNKVL